MAVLFAYLLSVFISYWLIRLVIWLDYSYSDIPVWIIAIVIPGVNIFVGLLFVVIAFIEGEVGKRITKRFHL